MYHIALYFPLSNTPTSQSSLLPDLPHPLLLPLKSMATYSWIIIVQIDA